MVFTPAIEPIDVITNKSIFLYDLNDFNLYGKMKPELQKEIENKYFELMISFVFKQDAIAVNLISDIKANFKVGPDFEMHKKLYDLTFKPHTSKMNFIYFFDQVKVITLGY